MPTGRDILLLLIGIIGVGTAGPIVALSIMPVFVLILWRNIAGSILMLPFAIKAKEWRSKDHRSGMGFAIIAGLALSLHFIGFFYAMRLTSVATGAALAAMQPIFAAIFVTFFGGKISRQAWIGMLISFAGVVLITGIDFQLSTRAFIGDLSAIGCGAMSAMYLIIGSHAQRKIATSTYTTICYASCAVSVLPFVILNKYNLIHYTKYQWMLLFFLFLGAQVMGHTMFNFTLKRVSATVVSLLAFFEVPVCAILAFWWMGQIPPRATIPGILLILSGCAIFVMRSKPSIEKSFNPVA